MEPQTHRATATQLATDLAWLEEHCRRHPELAVHTAHLRLSGALVRNVVGPAVDGQAATPLFIAVVGGAGTGKSTVVNFLAGSVVADANPQAGYTRHPTAFLPAKLGTNWPSYPGFLGSLQRLSDDKPANVDEDVYQVKKIPPGDGDALNEFVIWDCPDMTTWASSNYVMRLMEVVALADVVVYVASDERYNDEVPTQFLHLMIKAGKPVVCCLTKMREADESALVAHFRAEVLGKLPASLGDIPSIPVTAIPQLPLATRQDPAKAGAKYRVPLLNHVLALCPSAKDARQRTVTNAVKYLEAAGSGLLEVARRDLGEFENWQTTVNAGKVQFIDRYRREYLSGEAFRRFDHTRDQVMAMLDLPGAGKFLSTTFTVLRMPYKYLREVVAKTLTRPNSLNLSESAVCSQAMAAWLDAIQAEALRRSTTHPMWKQIVHGFDAGLKTQANDTFQQKFRGLELQQIEELDTAAKAVLEKLNHNLIMLQGLRIGVVVFELAVLIGFIIWTWPPGWIWLLIPIIMGLTHHLVEVIVKLIVDVGRNRLRASRENVLVTQLAQPMSTWLGDWPSSGGSAIEKLQQILKRVPDSIRDLARLVSSKPAVEPK